ncbi:MAG: YraN family protein [Dokdonella sp.]
MNTRNTGASYEDIALVYLEKAGLALLARNFTCRYGEIDLVMSEQNVVVFVEVRYRRGANLRGGYGDGVDSVSARKRAKLVRAAEVFLASHARLAQRPCRFDVLAIADGDSAPVIDWRRNAFEAY